MWISKDLLSLIGKFFIAGAYILSGFAGSTVFMRSLRKVMFCFDVAAEHIFNIKRGVVIGATLINSKTRTDFISAAGSAGFSVNCSADGSIFPEGIKHKLL